jgi:outer membrane protein assembly factor BamB
LFVLIPAAVIGFVEIPNAQAQERSQEILSHLVYQSRPTQNLLRRAERHLEQDQHLAAFSIIQKILDSSSDSFYWTSPTSLTSVRRTVREMLETMPAEPLKLYEKTYGAQAQQLLDQAESTHDRALSDEVARRFFATQAGFKALDRKATRLLDQGSVSQANAIWRDLISSSIHGKRCGKSIVLKTVATSVMLGRAKEARQILDDAATRRGLPVQAISEIEQVTRDIQPIVSSTVVSEWATPFGNVTHTASARGSAPYLNPAWSTPLAGDVPFGPIMKWEAEAGANELDSMAVANLPLVVNGQIIYRDFAGIQGRDYASGKAIWKYSSAISLPVLWESLETQGIVQTVDSLIEVTYTGNSLLGMLASDGSRVFAIEWTGIETEQVDGSFRAGDKITASNRLIALRIPQADGNAQTIHARRDWVAGNTSGTYETGFPAGDVLKGHLFLGAPLPVDGALFVMTEFDRVLNLVKVNSATGEVAWIQRVGLVEQPLFSGSQRRRQVGSYLPTYGNGLIICPTQAGALIAVDAITGATQWAYYYGESSVSRGRFSTRSLSDAKRSPGFVDPPHVVGNRIFYLPRLSNRLHCIDLELGTQIWAQRHDGQFIAVARTDDLLLIDNNVASGIDTTTGLTKWKKRLDIPAGRGVLFGDDYILPLKSGSISTINLNTETVRTTTFVPALLQQRFERYKNQAREAKNQRAADLRVFGLYETQIPSQLRLGNLVAHDDMVFSLGPQFLIAYPQLDSIVARTQQETERDLNTAARDLANRIIDTAEQRAKPDLQSFLIHGDSNEQAKARWLLRQLLLATLSQNDSTLTMRQQSAVIHSLDQLAEAPQERARVQLEQARWELEFGSTAAAVKKLFDSADLRFDEFIDSAIEYEGVITADVWRREALAKAANHKNKEIAQLVRDRMLDDLRAATKDDSIDALRHFLKMYQASMEAGRLRNRLADRLVADGRMHEAELLLLENRTHANVDVRAVSEAMLISLLSQLGLQEESGIRLHSMLTRFGDANLSAIFEDKLQTCGVDNLQRNPQGGFTGRDFIAQFDRKLQAWDIHQDLYPLEWQVDQVNVIKSRFADSDPGLGDLWADGRNMTSETDSELAVIRRGSFTDSEWAVIDRFHGTERGVIKMPGRFSLPVFPAYRQVGHFLPTGTMAGIKGISLLELDEKAPVWAHAFPPVSGTRHPMVEPGPAFPSICIFQTRKHLMGVHPGTGRVLWRRSDLDLASGVYVDKEAGLFGDEKVLVMFHSNLQSYDLLNTQTGETIRSGRLNLEFRYHRRLFGRKLMHVTRLKPGAPQRLRIWDPLTDTFDLDEIFVGRFYDDETSNKELSIVDSQGRLRVFQMPDFRKIVDLKLGKQFMSGVVSLRTFSDGETIYVNTQKNTGGTLQKYYFPATNSAIPFELVQQGSLMAVDLKSGEVKWTHPTRQKVVLRLDRISLPFMVAVSRVRPRNSSKTQTLEIEIIDRASGNLIGQHSTLFPDRLVHYRTDKPHGMLSLYGLQSRVDLDFSRRVQRILQDGPL